MNQKEAIYNINSQSKYYIEALEELKFELKKAQ
jgi:hypothetical protein